MKKDTKQNTEGQLLDLLKKVLPKATHDPELAGKIYQAVEAELRTKNRAQSFTKFCSRVELPDLDEKSIETVQEQLKSTFADADITLKPNRKEKTLAVELGLPDGAQLAGEIRVNSEPNKDDGEQEITLKFVAFPVCMPGDKELVWMLGKRENMSQDEAGIALTKLQDDFWGSKTGQKLLRDRVDRTFPEFISRVPTAMLSEVGLKRHYKTPEAIKIVRAQGK